MLTKLLSKLDVLTIGVAAYGYSRRWINKCELGYLASAVVERNRLSEDSELIYLSAPGILEDEELDKLVHIAIKDEKEDAMKKIWLLCHLLEIEQSEMKEDDKLATLQDVYVKFNYPENMSACSIYSQDKTPPLMAMSCLISKLEKDTESF